jgi:hypothetical protein
MIITLYNPLPIPCRDWDWSAHFPEPLGLPGEVKPASDENGEPAREFGATELEAIVNLIDSSRA